MQIPVLLLLFNRPKITKKLITRLREVRPKKIYINIDGPRHNNNNDKKLCKKVALIIKKNINWNTKVKLKINETNLGCRYSVSNAITWFFKFEKKGIILEDDCIPDISFFNYCEKMLNLYNDTNKVKTISGNGYQTKKDCPYDFYFSKYHQCWGWATWKRSWREFDNSMNFWKSFKNSKRWKNLHKSLMEQKYWEKKFNLSNKKKIDSWAYPFLASIWYKNGVSIAPYRNLVKNIGIDEDATHSYGFKDKYFQTKNSNVKIKCKKIKNIRVNKNADEFTFNNHFNGKYNFWPWRIIYLLDILFQDPNVFIHKVFRNIRMKF